MDSKLYLIGSLFDLQTLFPDHDFDHARKSLDGLLCVIEKEVTDEEILALESDNILVCTHEEALQILNGETSENVWYTKIDPLPVVQSDAVNEIQIVPESITEGTLDEPTDI